MIDSSFIVKIIIVDSEHNIGNVNKNQQAKSVASY